MSKNDFRKRTTSRETESPNALKKAGTNAPEQAGPKRDVFRRASEVQLFKMLAPGDPEVPGPAHFVDEKDCTSKHSRELRWNMSRFRSHFGRSDRAPGECGRSAGVFAGFGIRTVAAR